MGTVVLIETSWNVKRYGLAELVVLLGINRNIVECKAIMIADSNKIRFVLIETSWNVKDTSAIISAFVPCINRNIVECKALRSGHPASLRTGINRNIVECKGRTTSCNSSFDFVLIETSWNVKER